MRANHDLFQKMDGVISPNQIIFVDKNQPLRRQTLKRGPTGQAIIFPAGPKPLPNNIADEDLPVCDSSGQAQITLSDHQHSFSLNKETPRDAAKLHLMAMAVQHEKNKKEQEAAAPVEVVEEGAFHGDNLLEKLLLEPNNVQIQQSHKNVVNQSSKKTKNDDSCENETRFSKVFPALNDQAIDMLVRASEPETALDLMRQALSELNAEKRIVEGMPAYRHTLMQKSSQALLGHSGSKKLVVQASTETIPCTTKPSLLSSGAKKAAGRNTTSSPDQQQSSSLQQKSSATSSMMARQSLLQVQSKDRNSKDARVNITSPPQQKPKEGSIGIKVSGFNDRPQYSKNGAANKQSSYNQLQKTGGALKGGQSTNFASSNSTCEPSSNLLLGASSNKSSLITTPTNPSIVALTQNDLKARTKESNLIVCLYYNLACCYQRMGLLDEAVEYLELASDQLEDTVQYFESQEDHIIKRRHTQQPTANKPPQHKATLSSQYATEQPHKISKLDDGQRANSEYGKQGGANQVKTGKSRLLPAQPSIIKATTIRPKKKRQHSADNNNKNGDSQLGKKSKVMKRDKISIKDCQDTLGSLGAAQQHLSCLLKESQKATDFASGPSSLSQRKKLQDHMLILHHSAEQLEHTTITSSILPKSSAHLQFASFTNNNCNNYSTSLIDKHSSSGGRNVSPVTSASMPPDNSTILRFNRNDPNGLITVEQLLAEKMHKQRYQCKMNLQICALQSQLGKHQDALIFGRRAAQICYKLIKSAQMLCKRYVAQIQRHILARQTRGLRGTDQYGNTLPTQPDQGSLGDSPCHPQKILKAQTEIHDSFEDDYQAAQFCRRPQISRIEASLNMSSGKNKGRASSAIGASESSALKRPRSSCSSNRSSLSSQNGLTRLRLSQGSLAKLLPLMKGKSRHDKLVDNGSRSSRESSDPRTMNSYREESSTGSLDRIHTFNLKNSQANYTSQRQSQSVSEAQPAALLVDSKLQQQQLQQSVYQKGGPETSCGGSLKVSQVVNGGGVIPAAQPREAVKEQVKVGADHLEVDQNAKQQQQQANSFQSRNVYIEESVKVLESLIIQADPLLQELASIVKEFEDKSQIAAIDRDQEMIKKYGQQDFKDRRRRLKISFTTQQELKNLERDQRFKLNVRNTLGVKNSQDWIFNLNIGNVMHLNMMREQELNAKIENTHELTKDTMLEKVVLITSSYFCVATEIRFILQKDLQDSKNITKKDSEAFHAKALHIALLFLPEDCPLSQYINQTYCKNYLHPKLKLQKQRNAYLSQKLSKQHQTRQRQLAQTMADKEQRRAQQSQRAHTSLLAASTDQQVLKKPKLLISTKSQEGLTSGNGSVLQTPVLGGHGVTNVAASLLGCKPQPQTTTAAQAKSAQQAALGRKSGVIKTWMNGPKMQLINTASSLKQSKTPDSMLKNKSTNSEQKVGNSTVLRSQAMLKHTNPSVTMLLGKKARKSGGIAPTSTLHRAYPSIGSLLAAQFSSAGSGTNASKLRVKSPPSSTTFDAYQYSKNLATSPRSNQQQIASKNIAAKNYSPAQKNRDGSSVRKIKINLAQLASPENRPSLTKHHQRSNSSKRMTTKQKSSVHSYGLVPSKHISSSLQIKQSLGDCSNTSNSATGVTGVAVSSTITATAARISAGPASILKSPPSILRYANQSSATQSDASKQQAIMMVALKHLQSKQLSTSSARRKRQS